MNDYPEMGEIIRAQRKKLSLSLYALSSMTGISVSHLARIERGERNPSIKTMQKMAQPLGFDLNELLTMTGNLPPGTSVYSEEQKRKLQTELNTLLERLPGDINRVKQIIDRLLITQ